MALSEFDYALLSALAYSDEFNTDLLLTSDSWRDSDTLQDYITNQLENGGDLCIPPDDGRWITEEEWRAMLAAAAESEGLSGFVIVSVETNPHDGSEMVYLENEAGGEGCFVFEGTSTPEGWYQDGLILAPGYTESQQYAIDWAKGIMDANEAAGKFFDYSGGGQSKGGSQAAAVTREDPRISACYSFDGPGDDREHPEDPRIRCINNENDFVSALLFPTGKEVLLRSRSDDPRHASADGLGAHSPSNLFSFSYDEDGVLVCDGLADDVTDEGGAWYRELIRTVSQVAGRYDNRSRTLLANEVGILLWIMMNGEMSMWQKIPAALGTLVTMPSATELLVAAVAAGVAEYGLKKIADLLASLLDEAHRALAAAFITMAGAVRYAGARLSDAATAAAGIFASFVELPWNQIRAWVLDAIQGARGLYKSIGSHAGRPRAAAPGLSSSGSKVYDFSPARLEELRAAHERLMSMRLDSRPNWESRYGGAAFMGRLSLDPVQERIAGALEAERSAGEEIVEKASEAFRRAEAEDRRYAGELASMASAARSAAALLA